MNDNQHLIAIIRSAQDSVDLWRRNARRRDLGSSLTAAAAVHERNGILTSDLDRTIFRQVAYAIQSNVGHGYTNPGRLIDLGEQLGQSDDAPFVPIMSAIDQ